MVRLGYCLFPCFIHYPIVLILKETVSQRQLIARRDQVLVEKSSKQPNSGACPSLQLTDFEIIPALYYKLISDE